MTTKLNYRRSVHTDATNINMHVAIMECFENRGLLMSFLCQFLIISQTIHFEYNLKRGVFMRARDKVVVITEVLALLCILITKSLEVLLPTPSFDNYNNIYK